MNISRYEILVLGAVAMPLYYGSSAFGATPNLGSVDSGRVSDMTRWYGRAGGLTGSDRVESLRSGGREQISTGLGQHVVATWDEGTAKRTHMPLASSEPAPASHPFRSPRVPKY